MSTDAVFARPSLIAAEGQTPVYEGAGIFESACGVVDGLKNGDWGSFGGDLSATGLSALGAVMDPLQAIFAAGVGWLMEHVRILREPLDKLAGDPKAIEAHAESWRNVQRRIYEATDFFVAEVNRGTAAWASQAVDAYRRAAHTHAESMQALGVVADGLSEATIKAGGLVGAVRNTIRDIVADVVGACISKALQAFTVVLIPKVVGEVGALVAQATRRIHQLLQHLLTKLRRLGRYTAMLDSIMRRSRRTDAVGMGSQPTGRPLRKVIASSAKEATQANAAQSGGQTADALSEDEPVPHPIDLPL